MKDGTIHDRQITASSEFSARHNASNARLDRPATDDSIGAWTVATKDLNQWIQVEFSTYTYVSGIILQGREDFGNQWVTRYQVEYSSDGVIWQYVTDDNYVNDMVSIELTLRLTTLYIESSLLTMKPFLV